MTAGHIFLISRAQSVLDGLEKSLRFPGFQLDTENEPDNYLKKFSEETSLIVIDLSSLGEQGVALCTALRKRDGGRTVPIMFLGSGGESVRNSDDALDAGGDAFFKIPVAGHLLRKKVQAYLGADDQDPPDVQIMVPDLDSSGFQKNEAASPTNEDTNIQHIDMAIDEALQDALNAMPSHLNGEKLNGERPLSFDEKQVDPSASDDSNQNDNDPLSNKSDAELSNESNAMLQRLNKLRQASELNRLLDQDADGFADEQTTDIYPVPDNGEASKENPSLHDDETDFSTILDDEAHQEQAAELLPKADKATDRKDSAAAKRAAELEESLRQQAEAEATNIEEQIRIDAKQKAEALATEARKRAQAKAQEIEKIALREAKARAEELEQEAKDRAAQLKTEAEDRARQQALEFEKNAKIKAEQKAKEIGEQALAQAEKSAKEIHAQVKDDAKERAQEIQDRAIRDAEQDAEELKSKALTQAKKQAQEIQEQARREAKDKAREILAEAEEIAQQQAEDLLAQAEVKARKQAGEIKNQALAKAEKMEREALESARLEAEQEQEEIQKNNSKTIELSISKWKQEHAQQLKEERKQAEHDAQLSLQKRLKEREEEQRQNLAKQFALSEQKALQKLQEKLAQEKQQAEQERAGRMQQQEQKLRLEMLEQLAKEEAELRAQAEIELRREFAQQQEQMQARRQQDLAGEREALLATSNERIEQLKQQGLAANQQEVDAYEAEQTQLLRAELTQSLAEARREADARLANFREQAEHEHQRQAEKIIAEALQAQKDRQATDLRQARLQAEAQVAELRAQARRELDKQALEIQQKFEADSAALQNEIDALKRKSEAEKSILKSDLMRREQELQAIQERNEQRSKIIEALEREAKSLDLELQDQENVARQNLQALDQRRRDSAKRLQAQLGPQGPNAETKDSWLNSLRRERTDVNEKTPGFASLAPSSLNIQPGSAPNVDPLGNKKKDRAALSENIRSEDPRESTTEKIIDKNTTSPTTHPVNQAVIASSPSLALMPNSGVFENGQLPTLWSEIVRQSVSGRVDFVLDGGQAQRSFYFENGAPVLQRSTLARDRFEEFLLRRGLLSRTHYALAKAKDIDNARALSVALLEEGVLKTRELFAAVREHLAEGIINLFEWPRGRYSYVDERASEREMVSLATEIEPLIAEAIRRKFSLERLINAVGGPTTLIAPSHPELLDAYELTAEERKVSGFFDGLRNLEDIILAAGVEELLAYRVALICMSSASHELKARGLVLVESDRDLVQEHEQNIDRSRLTERLRQAREVDYFEFLGIERDATDYEIQAAVEKVLDELETLRMRGFDSPEDRSDIAEIWQVSQDALQVLGNEHSRERYRFHLRDQSA